MLCLCVCCLCFCLCVSLVSAGLFAPGQGQNLFNLLKNACDVLTYANSAKCSHLAAASFLRFPPLRPLLVTSSTSFCACVRACVQARVRACVLLDT